MYWYCPECGAINYYDLGAVFRHYERCLNCGWEQCE